MFRKNLLPPKLIRIFAKAVDFSKDRYPALEIKRGIRSNACSLEISERTEFRIFSHHDGSCSGMRRINRLRTLLRCKMACSILFLGNAKKTTRRNKKIQLPCLNGRTQICVSHFLGYEAILRKRFS